MLFIIFPPTHNYVDLRYLRQTHGNRNDHPSNRNTPNCRSSTTSRNLTLFSGHYIFDLVPPLGLVKNNDYAESSTELHTVCKEPHATYIVQPLVSVDCYLCAEGFGQDQHITHHSLIGTAQGKKKTRHSRASKSCGRLCTAEGKCSFYNIQILQPSFFLASYIIVQYYIRE